jgi:hypothetical protein
MKAKPLREWLLTIEGRIDDNDFKLVSDTGLTPGEISEIVAHVVLNIFTNYFNLVARTDIDWPQISVTV